MQYIIEGFYRNTEKKADIEMTNLQRPEIQKRIEHIDFTRNNDTILTPPNLENIRFYPSNLKDRIKYTNSK